MKMKRALVILQNYGGSMKKFKINVQRCGCVLLFFVLFIIILSVSASAEENESKVVRVGWYEGTYNMTDPNGQRSGYSYEYQQTVAAYTGWTYEYVTADWSELLKMLQDGKIDLMGGTIDVESELGKGTKFTVVLQLKIADRVYYEQITDKCADVTGEANIRGKRILLAEDNDLNAEIAMTILEDMGLEVERVEDGIKCVAKIEQEPSGSFDLILMDIQMPNMDGYKATQTIRHLADHNKACIPIVAMTANAFEEDRKKALDKGMNGHIAKPIDIDKVKAVLFSVLK